MGKEYSRIVSSSKNISESFIIASKVLENGKFKVKKTKFNKTSFYIEAKEKMKWLSTNWPVTVTICDDTLNGNVYFNIKARCGATSFTQDGHTKDVLDNIALSIEAYCK